MQRLLMLTHRVPFPPDKGDRIRTFNFLRFLSGRAEIHLACLADEPVVEETRFTLQQYCRRLAILPVSRWRRCARILQSITCGRSATEGAFRVRTLERLIETWTSDTRFDAVIVSSSGMAPYCRLTSLSNVPAMIDLMDVDSEKWLEYAQASRRPKAWLFRLEGHRVRRYETELASWA